MYKEHLTSFISQFLHYTTFSLKKPPLEFDTASLIISIDVDVGSPEVGVKNGGLNDCNVHHILTERDVGEIEEQVIPLLLRVFNELEFPATFALRGQLIDIENTICNQILESSTPHEIASHGYSHKVFTALSELEAEEELDMLSMGMKKIGVSPKSFVFPRNQISHLQLLERYGYLSFRAQGSLFRDGMYVGKCGNLFDIHPSIFFDFYSYVFYKKLINLAIKYSAPLHIWFHPSDVLFWNLGASQEVAAKRIAKGLFPLIEYAKKKKELGILKFQTMHSIAQEYQRLMKVNKA
jgi:peptidoglycan/xylan/chitin deacetylase (PgdA/CDA1 family)